MSGELATRVAHWRDRGFDVSIGDDDLNPGDILDATCGVGRRQVVRLLEVLYCSRGRFFIHQMEPVKPPAPPEPVIFEKAMGWDAEKVAELIRTDAA